MAAIKAKKPRLPDAFESARRSTELADRLRLCRTNWHEALLQPKYYRPTYPNRMTQFLTLSDNTMNALDRYLNLTPRETAERAAVLLAMLDVSVNQYCHIADLLNDAEVRERVSSLFVSQLRALEQGFSAFRQTRLPQMRAVRRELRLSTSLSAEQEKRLGEILATSRCSDDLSFLSM